MKVTGLFLDPVLCVGWPIQYALRAGGGSLPRGALLATLLRFAQARFPLTLALSHQGKPRMWHAGLVWPQNASTSLEGWRLVQGERVSPWFKRWQWATKVL